MNEKQKQRAQAALQEWRDYDWGWEDSASEFEVSAFTNKMAALLQEMIDAPEPEPFGYFKDEPFGWTDCSETDEGAIALYTAPPANNQSEQHLEMVNAAAPERDPELVRDAERYRWLRTYNTAKRPAVAEAFFLGDENLDAEIDAAIAAEKGTTA